MIMVGDALIHSSVYKDAHRLANYDGYDFKPQIELINRYDDDITLYPGHGSKTTLGLEKKHFKEYISYLKNS